MSKPTPENRQSQNAVEKAEEMVKELRAALARVGIKPPSLQVDPLTVVRDDPTPLVELGRCTPQMAALLVRALQAGRNTAGSPTS